MVSALAQGSVIEMAEISGAFWFITRDCSPARFVTLLARGTLYTVLKNIIKKASRCCPLDAGDFKASVESRLHGE